MGLALATHRHARAQTAIASLQTGDLLLFHGRSLLDKLIQRGTGTPWCHVALVLRDPDFTAPRLKGLFIWESGSNTFADAENNTRKFGVQIVDAHKRLVESSAAGTQVPREV